MDSSLHLVPGRYKLPTAPGGSLRKDRQKINSPRPQAYLRVCVCVCPVSHPRDLSEFLFPEAQLAALHHVCMCMRSVYVCVWGWVGGGGGGGGCGCVVWW